MVAMLVSIRGTNKRVYDMPNLLYNMPNLLAMNAFIATNGNRETTSGFDCERHRLVSIRGNKHVSHRLGSPRWALRTSI